MKKSSPISLFSFQDIITCLTGIMIVVVMMILIQLVQEMQKVQAKSEFTSEYQALLEHLQELKKRHAALKDHYVTLDKGMLQLASQSETELQAALEAEKRNAELLQEQLDRSLSELEDALAKEASARQGAEAVKGEKAKLAGAEKSLRQKLAEVTRLQRQCDALDAEIRRQSRRLSFEFPMNAGLTPILIECNDWGFRMQIYPDGRMESVGTPGRQAGRRQIAGLIDYLRTNRSARIYPVFLFRRSGLKIFEDIETALYRYDPELQIGKELLGDQEECFLDEKK